jgi:hypothetical protein
VGRQRQLLLIDQRNQRIRVIYDFATARENAIIDTIAGTGTAGFNGDGPALATQLNFPAGGNPEPSGGLSFGPDGALYFSDSNNNRVRKIVFGGAADFKDGQIVTVAGTGDRDFSGDGGQAVEAKIAYPEDLEFGPDGNLYFADTNNNRIRMVDLTTGVIATVVGNGEKGYGGRRWPGRRREAQPAVRRGLRRRRRPLRLRYVQQPHPQGEAVSPTLFFTEEALRRGGQTRPLRASASLR